jgi:hypothetical protein
VVLAISLSFCDGEEGHLLITHGDDYLHAFAVAKGEEGGRGDGSHFIKSIEIDF